MADERPNKATRVFSLDLQCLGVMDSDDDGTDNDSSSIYSSLFREHLAQFRAHLAGDDGQSLPSSYIPPTGYWTPTEKNIFFHGLSIYSALRPDLIANQLEHKTIVDVCTYIDLLAEASAEGSNTSSRVERRDLDIAMEVSDDWVALEEQHGARLSSLEGSWDIAETRKQREEMVKSEEARILGDITDKQQRKQLKQQFSAWKRDQESAWDKEHALLSLDSVQIRVLHKILVAEDSKHAVDQLVEPVAASTEGVSHIPIDPVLIAESAAMLKAARPVSDDPLVPPTAPESNPQTLPTPPSRSVITIMEPGEAVSPDLGSLSPKSRRRLQNRMYMRRKRAAANGTPVNEDMGVLSTGRKRKVLPPKDPVPPKFKSATYVVDSDDSEPDELPEIQQPGASTSTRPEPAPNGDGPPPYRHPRFSGLTKREKFRNVVRTHNIDAAALHEMNMDLFNLGAIDSMMKLYKEAYSNPADEKDVGSSLSAGTIHVLHNIIVDYITQILRRSIISREQENRLKANIKVWRRHEGDKELITHMHIEHALEMMGTSHLSKDKLFGKFLDRENSDEDEAAAGGDSESGEEASEDLDGDCDQIASEGGGRKEREPSLMFHLHGAMQAPLVRLPPHLSHVSDEEDLMAVDTDEDELMAELADESDVDHEDGLQAQKYESNLWDMGFS
ncbi:hypothetical protein BDZ89DRAFT_1160035 [Hymenopellis radicata]|nr:hypothetical protein BDZ89DRAFT_1160035 [Hymenopellis radicata]